MVLSVLSERPLAGCEIITVALLFLSIHASLVLNYYMANISWNLLRGKFFVEDQYGFSIFVSEVEI
jgi:hypothetical protein